MKNSVFFKKASGKSRSDLLVKLFSQQNISKADIDILFQGFNFDYASVKILFYIALLGKKHDFAYFPPEHIERLNGLLYYFHFKNLDMIVGFNNLAVKLNEQNIPVLLMKGAAIKFYFNQVPRYMADIDFLVPDENYRESIDIAVSLGFQKKTDTDFNYLIPHSTDLVAKSAAVDIHRALWDDNNYQAKVIETMFENALKTNAYGAKTLMPCREDLLLMVIANAYHNRYCSRDGQHDENLWMTDAAMLINESENFDWTYFYKNVAECRCKYMMDFMLSHLNYLSPMLKLSPQITEYLSLADNMDTRIKSEIYEKELWRVAHKIAVLKEQKTNFFKLVMLRIRKMSIILLKSVSIDLFFRLYDFKTDDN